MLIIGLLAFGFNVRAQSPAPWDGTVTNGDGSSNNPWQISTASQLVNLATYVNANNNVSSGKYYKLIADITLSGTWTPMGTSTTNRAFQGNFDGDYHTISELSINSTGDYKGFFGYINGATIQNLYVKTSAAGVITAGGNSGILVGYATTGSTVTQCAVVGKISGTAAVSAGSGIGGLIGTVRDKGTITKCAADVIVTNTSQNTGGLIGHVSNTSSANSCTIQNCYTKGSVTGSGNGDNWRGTGGLIGYLANYGIVSNCYSTATVKMNNNSGHGAGLVGVTYDCGSPNGSMIIRDCLAANSNVSNTLASGTTNLWRVAGCFSFSTASHAPTLQYNRANLSMTLNTTTTGVNGVGTQHGYGDSYGSFNQATYYGTASYWYNNTVSWDMTNTWGICDGHELPYLRWMNNNLTPPTVSASTNNPVCTGASITLTGTSTYPSISSITWTGAHTGNSTSGTPFSVSPTTTPTSTYTAQITSGGCTASASVTVAVYQSPSAPSVTTPVNICAGTALNLDATSTGNSINWYDNNTSTTPLNSSPIASGTPYTATTSATAGSYTYYAAATANYPVNTTFSYNNGIQQITLNPGTYQIECWGADGGIATSYTGTAGKGGYAKGTITVSTPTTYYIVVGGKPAINTNNLNYHPGGYNGGGQGAPGAGGNNGGSGGGATHIAKRTGLLNVLGSYQSDIIIVAGGGGGSGSGNQGGGIWAIGATGGAGGGTNGIAGAQSSGNNGGVTANGGGAGTPSAGGAGGTFTYTTNSNSDIIYYPGSGAGGGGGWYGGGGGAGASVVGGGTTYVGNAGNAGNFGKGGDGGMAAQSKLAWFTCGGGSGGGGSSYIGGVSAGTTTAGNASPPQNPDVNGHGYVKITGIAGGSLSCSSDKAAVQVTVTSGVTVNITPDPAEITCPASQMSLTASPSGGDGSNYAYSWTSSDGGTIISGNNTATPTVTAGKHIVTVTSGGCSAKDSTTVTTSSCPPPANDLCVNAITLPCSTVNLAGTTVYATPKTISGNTSSPYGVFYTFTGDGMRNTISCTAASGYIHSIVLFTGSCGSLSFMGYTNANSGGTGGETISYTFTTTLGTTYYIYIANPTPSSTQTGTFTLSRSCYPCTIPVLTTNDIDYTTAQVSWTGSATNGWLLEWGTTGNFTNTVSVSSSPYTIQGLQPDTEYNVRIRAICNTGDTSAYSNIDTFTTLRCEAVTDVEATNIGSTTANITWTNGSNPATGWIIEYSTDGDFNQSATQTATSQPYTLDNLEPNTTYYVRITTICGSNNSDAYSNVDTFTTQRLPCLAPTLSVSNVESNSATITWTNNGNDTEIEYLLEYGMSNSYGAPIAVTQPYELTGLQASRDYCVRLRTVCGVGDTSAYSNVRCFTTPLCHHPTNVGADRATIGNTIVDISWLPGSSTENEWLLEYGVQGTFDNEIRVTTPPPYQLTGLEPVTCYNVRMRTICAADEYSAYSNIDTFCTEQIPCPDPTNLAIEDRTDHTITVSWERGGTETQWKIMYSTTDFTGQAITSTRPYTLVDLQSNTTYQICVVAICAPNVESDPSYCIYGTTVGLHDITLANVKLYPNPATDKLTVEMENKFNTLEVTNTLGQTLYRAAVTDNQMQIDVSGYSAGMYYVKLQGDNGMVTKKFVKE